MLVLDSGLYLYESLDDLYLVGVLSLEFLSLLLDWYLLRLLVFEYLSLKGDLFLLVDLSLLLL